MSLAIFEFIKIVIAVILCALAVKLTDDYLDQDIDIASVNLIKRFGNGTIIYGMLAITLAAAINSSVSIPLFFASYIIGMFNNLSGTYLSHLNGYQESLIVSILGITLFDLKHMLFAIFLVLAIQLIDDYIDIQRDILAGKRNFANSLGKFECVMSAIISLLIAYYLNGELFLPVSLGIVIVYLSTLYYQWGVKR